MRSTHPYPRFQRLRDEMRTWLKNLRVRYFPSGEEYYQQGVAFAKDHFNGCRSEDEADMLYEGLPMDNKDLFDKAITDYWRTLCCELRHAPERS